MPGPDQRFSAGGAARDARADEDGPWCCDDGTADVDDTLPCAGVTPVSSRSRPTWAVDPRCGIVSAPPSLRQGPTRAVQRLVPRTAAPVPAEPANQPPRPPGRSAEAEGKPSALRWAAVGSAYWWVSSGSDCRASRNARHGAGRASWTTSARRTARHPRPGGRSTGARGHGHARAGHRWGTPRGHAREDSEVATRGLGVGGGSRGSAWRQRFGMRKHMLDVARMSAKPCGAGPRRGGVVPPSGRCRAEGRDSSTARRALQMGTMELGSYRQPRRGRGRRDNQPACRSARTLHASNARREAAHRRSPHRRGLRL